MTVKVIKLPLQPELLLIGHSLLYRASTKGGLANVLYRYELQIYHAIICKLIRQTQFPRV
jgi:hypothetical protein